MSRTQIRRKIPVGLLESRHRRPRASAQPVPPATPLLRPGLAWAAIALLWLVGLAVTAVGLRPVPQSITTWASVSPPVPPVELAPPPRLAEPVPEPGPVALAEARPLSRELLALLARDTGPVALEPDDPLPPGPARCDRFGTSVDFVRSSSLAFQQAARDRKLVMVLHLAGNFEDPGFT